MRKKFLILLFISFLVSALSYLFLNFSIKQAFIIGVFSTSILGTLFFWDFRVGFAFIGSGLMLLIHAVNLEDFVKYASLDVIWFLVGMMIILAMMKEAGVFYYLLTKILRIKKLDGEKLFIIILVISWILSGLMGEVTSILLILNIIFSISELLEVSPVPLIISSVITTNIGSAATVLGNPIGVLIAVRGKLSFEDFITHSLPVTLVCLFVSIIILKIFYRKYISELSLKLKPHIENSHFLHLISTPMDKKTKFSVGLFVLTAILISLHRRLELLLSLEENTILIMTPIIIAGLILIINYEKATKYIEQEIEWNSLLFFLFLFAQSGVLQSSGIAGKIAEIIANISKTNSNILSLGLLFSSGSLSSVLDNVVVVASYIPVVLNLKNLSLQDSKFWWAILFGGCFGGNITLIGSTANIIALGLLEKIYHIKIKFFEWVKIGLIIGIITMLVSYVSLFFYK
jgi:Na+/H+ antiporter NhaD/arsenite permease-like protein